MSDNIRRMIAFGRIALAAAIGFAGVQFAGVQSAALAAADEPRQSAPAPAGKKHRAHAARPAASREGRHAVCLAFIQRHGLSCDPWVEPTCGADTGYFRPPECVRPLQ